MATKFNGTSPPFPVEGNGALFASLGLQLVGWSGQPTLTCEDSQRTETALNKQTKTREKNKNVAAGQATLWLIF